MPSQLGLTYKDYARQTANTRFDVTALTAANLVAETVKHEALITAIEAVVLGNLQRKRTITSNTYVSGSPSSEKQAARELKWLLTAEDSTTHKLFRHEIATADLDLLDQNSEFLDLTADPGLALKTAFDACVISPEGNASVLVSVQKVGKRL